MLVATALTTTTAARFGLRRELLATAGAAKLGELAGRVILDLDISSVGGSDGKRRLESRSSYRAVPDRYLFRALPPVGAAALRPTAAQCDATRSRKRVRFLLIASGASIRLRIRVSSNGTEKTRLRYPQQ